MVLGSSVSFNYCRVCFCCQAGFVGGGGLGTIAINYGYNRYQTDLMTWPVIVIVVLVQLLEFLEKEYQGAVLAINK